MIGRPISASRIRELLAAVLGHRVAVSLVLATLTATPTISDDRRPPPVNPATGTALALPAFAGASEDEGVIGSAIPSHQYPVVGPGPAAASIWAIWNGSLKAYRLDNHGRIPSRGVARLPGREQS